MELVQERGHLGCKLQGHRIGTAQALGTHILLPCAPDSGYGALGLNVCPSGYQSGSGPHGFFLLFLPFGMGIFALCHCIMGLSKLFHFYFYFLTVHSYECLWKNAFLIENLGEGLFYFWLKSG